jgi:hypothetical protein
MSDVTSTKPYCIAKRTVWEAYQLVRANRGAAGVDDETIAMFEQNLSGNLYKLWNGFVRQGSQLIGAIRGRVFTSGIMHGSKIQFFCHALQRTTEVRQATQAAQTKLRSPELV